MRTLAAASPPSSTLLDRNKFHESQNRRGDQPDKVDIDDVFSVAKSGPANEEDGELRDDGGDDDGEADGGVAVVTQECHQETESSKQHDVDVDNHYKT